eukprot:6179644-Amphidinium_carterae.1
MIRIEVAGHVVRLILGWQVTFDSYLYKTVQGNDPVGDVKLLGKTVSSLIKNNSTDRSEGGGGPRL